MSERTKKFHTIALQSSLFKGRSDWYFCYLKAEKIAHVLMLLAQRSSMPLTNLSNLTLKAESLPSTIVHFAAGNIESAEVLAELFSLISSIRISGTQNRMSQENVAILVQELEQVAERIATQSHPSPFVTTGDFSIPATADTEPTPLLTTKTLPQSIKDIHKGHKGHEPNKGHSANVGDRMSLILNFLRTNGKRASIKDISKVVRNCSNKTIQRELATLTANGLVRKEGERRWSVYSSV